jgi:hypothetical protein
MTTEINTAELRKLAESATSGPWAYTGPEYGDEGGVFFNIESPAEVILGEFGPSKANAKFIAAADPSTMLALLDRLAVLEDENERMIDKIGELHDRVAAASQQGSEPVAWMLPTGHGTGWRDRAPDGEFAHKWTPLFTHPIAPAGAGAAGKAALSRGDAGALRAWLSRLEDSLSESHSEAKRLFTQVRTYLQAEGYLSIAAAQGKENDRG